MLHRQPLHKLDYDPQKVLIVAGTIITFLMSIPILMG